MSTTRPGARNRRRPADPDDGLADAANRLHSAAIHLLRRLRRVDEASGLTAARLSALSVVVFGGPCSLGELARAEQVRPPSMTRIVAELEAEGLVRREVDARDRRVSRIHATPTGVRLLEAGRSRRVTLLAEWLGALAPQERRRLCDALPALERLVQQRPVPGPSQLPNTPSEPEAQAEGAAAQRPGGANPID